MPNEEATKTLLSVGETLKQARVKAGLSVADVAAKLHLATKYVDGIEADDLRSLPQSLVFKRGYIRSYARMLKISDEYIQQLLHAQGLIEVPVVKKIIQPEKPQITVRDKRVRWITYGIGLLFLLLLISWWHSQVGAHHDPEVKAPVSNEPAVLPTTPPEQTKPAVVPEPVKKESIENKSVEAETKTIAKPVVTMPAAKPAESASTINSTSAPKVETKKRTDVADKLNFDANS